jgi:5-methylcytosine-specific restriction protein B
MALVKVVAVMWRTINRASVDTLAGRSNGQYDIRLGTAEWLHNFFAGLTQEAEGDKGGFVVHVPLEALSGENPVEAQALSVKFMGADSVRKDWNIPAQRPTTAYALWRMGRGLPTNHVFAATDQNWIVIARDDDNRFHARWINSERFAALPLDLQQSISASPELGRWFDQNAVGSGLVAEVVARLHRHHNVLLYGPPGTGKTHLIQEVMKAMTSTGLVLDTSSESTPFSIGNTSGPTRSAWATFHQSYSYEDFIVSLRPEPSPGTMLNLVPSPGLLIELAEYARQPNHSALLVIDEINRGNVSRIFGEFITLLESDKRLADDGQETASTIKIRFPYVKEGTPLKVTINGTERTVPSPFTMPRRVYTLATMNSVDKSVAPLDTALRRRFEVFDLPVDYTAVAQVMDLPVGFDGQYLELPVVIENLSQIQCLSISVLRAINTRLGFFLGTEYCLGHWYLAGMAAATSIAEAETAMQEVWDAKVLPQLEELFRGRTDQLESVLRLDDFDTPDVAPVYLENPSDALSDLGAAPLLRRRKVSFDQFAQYLRHLGGVTLAEESPADAASAETPETTNIPVGPVDTAADSA